MMRRVWLNRHGLLRVVWRVPIYGILLAACGLLVNLLARPLFGSLGLDVGSADSTSPSMTVLILGYGMTVAAVFASSAVMVRFIDRRRVASLGLGLHSRWARELGIGLGLGAIFVSAIVAVQLAGGTLQLEWSGVAPGVLAGRTALHVLFFVGVAFFEELLFRGYLLQVLAEGFGDFGAYLVENGRLRGASRQTVERVAMGVAALLLSAPFGFLHYFNSGGTLIGAVSAGSAGLLLCLAYFRTRSLWIPVGLHTTWNLFIAWVYSLPVSGEVFPDAPWTATVSGPEWLSGGEFGPEGSVLAFLAMGCMAVLLTWTRQAAPSPEAAAWYTSPEARRVREPAAADHGEGQPPSAV